MREVVLAFTDKHARIVESYLRERYDRDGRTNLNVLCKIAVLREVRDQARVELEQAEREL